MSPARSDRTHPIQAALAGAGPRAALHAVAAAAAGIRVVAVADDHHRAAQALGARLGARAVSPSALPDGAGIVVVTVPSGRRAAAVTTAVAAGATAVVEAPMAATPAEADAVVAAAGLAGTLVLYSEAIAYAPAVQAWLSRVGPLGPLTDLEVRLAQPAAPPAGRFAGSVPGGALFELGVTAVALTILAAAPARPVSVRAQCSLLPGGDVDDHAEVCLDYDTGLVARVTVSHRSQGPPLWEVQAASATGVVRAELLPRPMLEANGVPVSLPSAGGAPPELTAMGLVPMWRAFADDITRRRRPVMDAAFGRAVLDVVCAAYAAAGHGGAEPLPYLGDRRRLPIEGWRPAGTTAPA